MSNAFIESLTESAQFHHGPMQTGLLQDRQALYTWSFRSPSEWRYKRGEIDDALFWLNAAGLRGRFDAKICTDISAQSAIAELSERIPPDLFREQWKDSARIKRIVDRVIDWDAKTPAEYDHRWISLHGLKAVNAGLGMSVAPGPLTLPEAQWRDIGDKNRESYRADMYRYAAGDRRQTN